jgi:hypothetical protein
MKKILILLVALQGSFYAYSDSPITAVSYPGLIEYSIDQQQQTISIITIPKVIQSDPLMLELNATEYLTIEAPFVDGTPIQVDISNIGLWEITITAIYGVVFTIGDRTVILKEGFILTEEMSTTFPETYSGKPFVIESTLGTYNPAFAMESRVDPDQFSEDKREIGLYMEFPSTEIGEYSLLEDGAVFSYQGDLENIYVSNDDFSGELPDIIISIMEKSELEVAFVSGSIRGNVILNSIESQTEQISQLTGSFKLQLLQMSE